MAKATDRGRGAGAGGDRRRRVVSLARALSKLGLLSRGQAAAAIAAGRVSVAGQVVRDPARRVDPDRDDLKLDGIAAIRQRAVTLVLHKPQGVVTTRSDERGRSTVYDLLPPALGWVFPVGRLDRDSTGLLVLTNDTRLGDALSGPEADVAKVYEVDLDRPLDPGDQERFRRGTSLADGTILRPVALRIADPRQPERLVFELHEGKNRQIRRMVEEAGRQVRRLHRIRIGAIALGDLAPGAYRELTDDERAFTHQVVRTVRRTV